MRQSLTAERADTIPMPACPVVPKYPMIKFPRGNASVPFAPKTLYALDPQGAIWCAAAQQYEVWHIPLSATKPDRVVSMKSMAEAITPKERDEALAGLREFAKRAGGGEVSGCVLPKTKPILSALTVDDRGRLWVLREQAGRTSFDVFGAGPAPIATVTIAPSISDDDRIVIRNGVLTAVALDEEGTQRVVRFRIKES